MVGPSRICRIRLNAPGNTHNVRMPYRNLIYINKKIRGWASIFSMLKTCTKGFELARMTVLATTLLLAPFAVFAGGLEHHASKPVKHSAANHQADAVLDSTSGNHGAPAETPLHCHEKSSPPQATGLVLEPISPDQPLLVLESVSPPPGPAASALNRSHTRIPIAGPPRFILFNNFRS